MFHSDPDWQPAKENLWLVTVGVLMIIFTFVILTLAAFSSLAAGSDGGVPPATETPPAPPTQTLSPPVTIAPPLPTSVMSLEVGDCFDVPQLNAQGFIEELTVLDCNAPHDREVFASLQFPEGDGTFPGAEGFDDFSEEGCVAAFETYVGLRYDDSAFFISTLEPTQDSWDSGDREILCILYEPEVKSTSSARGTVR